MKRCAFSIACLAAVVMLCAVLLAQAAAQARPAAKGNSGSGHKLIALKASGTMRFSDKEILAASGLELGQNAAEGDLQEATQKLGNSGLFKEVLYTFSYSDAGIKAEFQLSDVDASKLVPVQFDNFVWFTDRELQAAVAERVPLFKNAVPASGPLTGRVTRGLQALLDERHIPGRVDFLHEAKLGAAETRAIVFRVEDLAIRIHGVDFPGASAEQSAFLAVGARKLAGAEYSRSMLEPVVQNDLLPLLLRHGYLKAEFGRADAHVAAGTGEGKEDKAEDKPKDEVEADVSVPVTPGKQYSVSGVTWKGNSAIATEEGASLFHLTAGQPADAVRLRQDVEVLTKLYRSRGYMKAQIKPEAQLDEEKSSVGYVMRVVEGDLYTMGELEIVGVDTASKERLRAAWTLREGAPYNADFAKKFLEEAPRLLPKGLQYSVKLSEELDAKERTVDVTLQFKAE